MKTLTNQTLIYDEDCPLCRAYSGAFVQAGMLDRNGRMPYSQLTACDFIDYKRAANEIALVDYVNRKTIYGIDSLLAVIAASFPLVGKIGHFAPVHFLLTKLYRFISYNRKVIMPNPESAATRTQCLPDFNVGYRLLYLLVATLSTAFSLHAYSLLLPKTAQHGLGIEFAVAFGQMAFQTLFLFRKDFKTLLDYAGNLMTVSVMGATLLIPMLIANQFVFVHEFTATTYFLLVATVMFTEHFRRVGLLGLPKMLCTTWVLYHILILAAILL